MLYKALYASFLKSLNYEFRCLASTQTQGCSLQAASPFQGPNYQDFPPKKIWSFFSGPKSHRYVPQKFCSSISGPNYLDFSPKFLVLHFRAQIIKIFSKIFEALLQGPNYLDFPQKNLELYFRAQIILIFPKKCLISGP